MSGRSAEYRDQAESVFWETMKFPSPGSLAPVHSYISAIQELLERAYMDGIADGSRIIESLAG